MCINDFYVTGIFSIVSGGKYAKYGCSNNWNKGSSCCKNSVKINKGLLEELIICTLIKELSCEETIKGIIDEIYQIIEDYLSKIIVESDVTIVKQELQKINHEIRNMINAIKSGIISEALKQESRESENKKRIWKIN